MAPKFSTVFCSQWPNDGSDEDSDFADDCQPDVSTDDESMMSGDVQVIAEGRAIRAANEDSEFEAGQKEVAAANDEATTDEGDSSGEERLDASLTELTDEQINILSRRVPEFRAADLEGRVKIVTSCVDHIKRTWTQSVAFNRDRVETHVWQYLFNKRKRDKYTFDKKWTYKDIFVDVHRLEIDKLAAEMSGSKPGSPAYLGCYTRAIKIIEDKLDEETWQKYRAQAKKWSEQKPPPRQQQRMFEKHGVSALREFSESMYRQYGVRVAVLAGYCDGDGEPTVLFHDINNELGGTSFKSRYKGWPKDPMVKDFSKWTAESFGVEPSNEEDIQKDTKGVKLSTDEAGYPILPTWEAIKHERIAYKKALTSTFVREMYRIAVGGGKGRIPWSRMEGNQEDYILPEYLPEGIVLNQFHHMRLEDLNSLLQHWTRRQASGEIHFRFKGVDREGKRASAMDNTPIEAEPRAQSEAEPQESRGGQEREGDSGGNGGSESSANKGPDRQDQDTNSRPKPRRVITTPQAVETSPDHVSRGSNSASRPPAQPSANNDQTTAGDPQGLPQRRRKKNGSATNTSPSKRLRVDNNVGNAQPTIRRSERTIRPTEWAMAHAASRKRAHR